MQSFGDIMNLTNETKSLGYVVLTYYDIRAARLALHSSHGMTWRDRQLSCSMVKQQGLSVANGGSTLFLCSLNGGKSLDDAYYLLSMYGELRDLQKDPARPLCCIADFFDSRHAAAALQDLSNSVEIQSRLLVFDAASSGDLSKIVGNSDRTMGDANSNAMSGGNEYMSYMSKNLSEISFEKQQPSISSQYLPPFGGNVHQSSSAGDVPLQRHSSAALYSNTGNNSVWPQSNSSLNSLGSSPTSSLPWIQSQEVLVALQAQQRARQAHQMQAQNKTMHAAAFQRAFMHPQEHQVNSNAYPYGGNTYEQAGNVARRNNSDISLGGRLARRQMHPVAEAERKAQQDRLYGLDMNKILAGDDKRTTLMIKNIPNKYTQKMLLAVR